MTSLRRPLAKYFGSKWTGAKYYPAPRYDQIVETHSGMANYSAKYTDRKVLLFDVDYEVIDLLRWLITVDQAVVRSLPTSDLPLGFDLRNLPGVPRAAQDLIRRWQRIGHCSSWTVSSWNGKPGMWSDATRDSVAESIEAIRHWEALLIDDYSDIPVAEIGEATWFVDPLYQFGGKGGYRCHKSHDYKHLAKWVRSLPGQVIVCEQEGANWLPFRSSHDITGIKRRVHHKTANTGKEMIWLSDWERNPAEWCSRSISA